MEQLQTSIHIECEIQFRQESAPNWFSEQQDGVRGASGTRGAQGSKMLLYIYNSNKPGTKTMISRVDTATHGVKTQPLWLVADWLGFVEPVPPREDKVPSPDQKSFHTTTTPTNRGRKR